jgi:hypothetical protein
MTIEDMTGRLLEESMNLDWVCKGLIGAIRYADERDWDETAWLCEGVQAWQFWNPECSDEDVNSWVKDVSMAWSLRIAQDDLRSIGEALIKLSQGEANSSEDPTYDFTPWRANAATA